MGLTRKTCCNMELRTACRTISIVFSILDVGCVAFFLWLIFSNREPAYVVIAPIVYLLIDVSLLFGVHLENACLVLIWLFKAGWDILQGPIAIMVVLYKFHEYSSIDFAHLFLAGIIGLLILYTVLFIWLFGIVRAYWRQLRNNGHLNTQHHSNVIDKV